MSNLLDASDVLRRIQAQTQYNYKLYQLGVTQPGANISTLTSDGIAKINYKSYAERQNIALGKFYATGGSTIGFGFIPNTFSPRVAQPVTFRAVFTYTGAAQTYPFPASLSSVSVWVWGAGGGDGGGQRGGSAAFISGALNTGGLSALYIVVGGIGGSNVATGAGGNGTRSTSQNGSGGGFSGIFRAAALTSGNLLCCAGGGGGEGIFGSAGGAGGLTTGGNATAGGTGGTQSAGGTAGGGLLQGGNAVGGDAGGGGGGYYGGGGATNNNDSGGGGSSYTTLLAGFAGEAGKQGQYPGVTPGGTTNPNYVAPYGASGNYGYVVISGTYYA